MTGWGRGRRGEVPGIAGSLVCAVGGDHKPFILFSGVEPSPGDGGCTAGCNAVRRSNHGEAGTVHRIWQVEVVLGGVRFIVILALRRRIGADIDHVVAGREAHDAQVAALLAVHALIIGAQGIQRIAEVRVAALCGDIEVPAQHQEQVGVSLEGIVDRLPLC